MTAPVPHRWAAVPFEKAFAVISDRGRRVPVSSYLSDGSVPVVDQGEGLIGGYTNDNSLVVDSPPPLVVFGDHTRRIKYVDFPFAVGAQGVKLLRAREGIDPRFAYWFITSQQLPSRGYGRHFALLRQLSMPVPPIEEQRRIVDLLEEHLSRLDAGTQQLRNATVRLGGMERAVMAVGYQGGHHVGLGEVSVIQGGIQKQPSRDPRSNAYPFLRVANVTSRGLDLVDVHKIELFPGELERLRLQKGDLLVVEGNGSANQIGRAATWDGSIQDCVHQNHLIRVRPLEGLLPGFLEAVWNSPQVRAQLTELASSSSGLYTLSVSKLKSLTIPMPDLRRQEQVVTQVAEARQTRARVGGSVRRNQVRADQLRRSILAAAFSGRLTATHATPAKEWLSHV